MLNDKPCTKTNRHRGLHSTKVKNANPDFAVPETHKKRLAVIDYFVKKSASCDVTQSDVALYVRPDLDRQKAFYMDRRKAIRAIHKACCEYLNLVTHQVQISLTRLAEVTGLYTISQAEKAKTDRDPHYEPKKNITRLSRAINSMIEMGWIVADAKWQVWDKEAGIWVHKYFEVTELFFAAMGVPKEKVQKEQSARLAYLKKQHICKGYNPDEIGNMSIKSLKALGRTNWIKKCFEFRKQKAAKKRLSRQLDSKSRSEQRTVAAKRVMDQLGDAVSYVSFDEFKNAVNKEVAVLRKFTGVTPTTS